VTRSAELRRRLVETLDRDGSIRVPAVRDAFLAVPRELFVPEIAAESGLDRVYVDDALVTRKRDGMPTSSSSQPTIMALMLEALDLRSGDRVLEIGLGTGYNAAILREIVGASGTVTSLDIDPDVIAGAERALRKAGAAVRTVRGDGSAGCADWGPYDRIIATASTDHIPRAWWEQLAPDGIVVAPLRFGALQLVVVLARTASGFVSTRMIPGGFMPMRPAVDAPASVDVSITVETNPGDGTSSSLTIGGPGLALLDGDARGALVGRLLGTPRVLPVEPLPARSVLWHAILAAGVDRSIATFASDQAGGSDVLFGTVDATGAAALLRIGRQGDGSMLEGIELYGPADAMGRRLVEAGLQWRAAGEPSFEKLVLAIDYDEPATAGTGMPAPAWAVASKHDHGQRRATGWRI
jgi:protein-L-isoaspartate(D-aspartate) O-methyltransferase